MYVLGEDHPLPCVVCKKARRDRAKRAERIFPRHGRSHAHLRPAAAEREIYEAVSERQRQLRGAEIESGLCLVGAHKDDLLITINGADARSYASQGQTRTAALSLKLAEREIFLAETGETPVLLLDDVLSELDSARQEFVLNRIGGGQTLVSCCEAASVERMTGGRVLYMDKGRVNEACTSI